MAKDFNIVYEALLLHLVNEAKNCVLSGKHEDAYTLAKSFEIFASLDRRGEI